MGSDAIANVPLSSFAKDSPKKKRGSRLTKLKQNKLDVRREQWLSQVNNNRYKIETTNTSGAPPSSIPKGMEGHKTRGNISTKAREDKHEILVSPDGESLTWMSSSIGRKKLGLNNNGLSKDSSKNNPSSSCSGSCSSSSTISEEDIHESCLDDWEAVADALTIVNTNQGTVLEEQHREPEPYFRPKGSNSVSKVKRGGLSHRAWSPNDAFRPRNLPSLSKQQRGNYNLMKNSSERCFSEQQPSSCPICCEDFDVTDLNFHPCPCGFRLCLFCHKRILEVDGRCPGCRKQYDSVNAGAGFRGGAVAFQMTSSSCSKNARF